MAWGLGGGATDGSVAVCGSEVVAGGTAVTSTSAMSSASVVVVAWAAVSSARTPKACQAWSIRSESWLKLPVFIMGGWLVRPTLTRGGRSGRGRSVAVRVMRMVN